MFRVGQKVVRVSGKTKFADVKLPPLGVPCTVINVFTPANGLLTIELAEYPRPETAEAYAGFVAKHFRPVVERKTDISSLQALLVPGTKILEGV